LKARAKTKWITASLGDLINFRRELINPTTIQGQEKFVGLEHINGEDGSVMSVSALTANLKSTKARFFAGDILYGKLRPYLKKITIPPFGGICSADILVLSVNEKRAASRYLFYYLRQQKIVNFATDRSAGANLPRLSPAVLLGLEIHLPESVQGQHEIAEILDTAARVKTKRQEAVKLTEELLRSVFLDMFGDPITNSKGWPKERLGDFLSFLTNGSRGWAKYYSEGGVKFLRIQNVTKNRLLLDDVAYVNPPNGAEAERTKVKPGDVLLSITADLGRTGVIPEDFGEAHINQHLAILRVRGIRPLYLSAYLASEGGQAQVKRLNKEGVKADLNFDDIRSIAVLVPPDNKQKEFEKIFYQIIELLKKENEAFKESENLFNSLLQRAFQGEL
jgi:type I restriction enzyme S subunit